MEVRASERRVTRRHQIKTALQLRVWKSGPTELRVQSLDLSEKRGLFRHRCAHTYRIGG